MIEAGKFVCPSCSKEMTFDITYEYYVGEGESSYKECWYRWYKWKVRPVFLFESNREKVDDISLFSEKVNIIRDYRIIFKWTIDAFTDEDREFCEEFYDTYNKIQNDDDEDTLYKK